MKNCCRCKQSKALVDFSKLKSSSDGYNQVCKLCCSEKMKINYQKNFSYYLENADKRSSCNKDYYVRNKDTVKIRVKNHYNKNRDTILYNKSQRSKNKRYISDRKYREWVDKRSEPGYNERYVIDRRSTIKEMCRKYRQDLSDTYIKHILINLGAFDISPEIIRLKRLSIMGKRKIKQLYENKGNKIK